MSTGKKECSTLAVITTSSTNYTRPRLACMKIPDRQDGKATAAVAQSVEHRKRHSKVAGSVSTGGMLSFQPL